MFEIQIEQNDQWYFHDSLRAEAEAVKDGEKLYDRWNGKCSVRVMGDKNGIRTQIKVWEKRNG